MTYTVADGYDRRKTPAQIPCRDLTKDEVLGLKWRDELRAILNNRLMRVRVNGKVRTWKRDAERIEVPLKYGLKECFTARWNGTGLVAEGNQPIVKEVTE